MYRLKYIIKRMFIAAAISSLLCACGRKTGEEKPQAAGRQEVLSHETGLEDVPEPSATPFAVYYDIRLESGAVTLYEVTAEGSNAVKSVKIDEEYYPAEDINALKQGISAYSEEGAYEILENFAN